MSDNVVHVQFRESTPDELLAEATGALKSCVIMGWDTEGVMFMAVSDGVSIADANLWADILKAEMIGAMIGGGT